MTIDAICEGFGVLPSQAVRELEEDPDLMVLDILELRAYRAAKRELEIAMRTDLRRLEAWAGSPVMARVERNAYELRQERVARARTRA